MKRKLLLFGIPIAGAAALAGVGIASAAGLLGGSAAVTAGPMMGGGGFGGGENFAMSDVSPTTAAANQATEFQNEASASGLSESAIVAGWAAGESLDAIATANGMSTTTLQTNLKSYAAAQRTAELQALVANGTITQDQMNARVQFEATQQAQMEAARASGKGMGGRGFHGQSSATSTSTGQ